jgi:hypothetical protein
VPEYLLELYVSRENTNAAAEPAWRIRAAVEQLTLQGTTVHCSGTILVPAEETCFVLFVADSADAVCEAARLASLPFDRVNMAFSQP